MASTGKAKTELELTQRVDLDLDLHKVTGMGGSERNGGADAASRDDMVVLDQDGIEQTGAVIAPAAAANGVFLKRAQARRRLARVGNRSLGARDGVGELPRQRGDATHAAEKIEGHALSGQ